MAFRQPRWPDTENRLDLPAEGLSVAGRMMMEDLSGNIVSTAKFVLHPVLGQTPWPPTSARRRS